MDRRRPIANMGLTLRPSPGRRLGEERERLEMKSATKMRLLLGATFLMVLDLAAPSAMAQPVPSGPPPVGVIKVERRPMSDSYEFNGRIQAINSVNIVARVTGFLD